MRASSIFSSGFLPGFSSGFLPGFSSGFTFGFSSGFLSGIEGIVSPPAFDTASFTASIIPPLENVAPDTVSTLFPGFPNIFDIKDFALAKYVSSSWWDRISTFVIEPFDMVTLTFIGPLKPSDIPS